MRRKIDNLFEWKREVRPEEETYPGENEDLKKIDSIKSDLQGIFKEREKEEKRRKQRVGKYERRTKDDI